MFKLSLRPNAERDIQHIVGYYDDFMPDLADDFLEALENAYTYVLQNPRAYQKRFQNVRAIFIKRFHIGVYYKIYGKKVVVIAVLHTHRSPKVWQGRG